MIGTHKKAAQSKATLSRYIGYPSALAHKNYAHCAPSVDNFLPFCALCTANALLTQRILSILWITFSKNYNSLAAAFTNEYATPSQKIRKISDGNL